VDHPRERLPATALFIAKGDASANRRGHQPVELAIASI
jgi:hypothetical protein